MAIIATSLAQEDVSGYGGAEHSGEEDDFGGLSPISQGLRRAEDLGGGILGEPKLGDGESSGLGHVAAGWYCTSMHDENPSYAYNDMNCDGRSSKVQNCGQAWCCKAIGYECSASHRVHAAACMGKAKPRCQGAMRTNLMEAKASVGKVRHPASYRLAETKGGKKGGSVWPKKATHSKATAMRAEDEDESESAHQKQLDHEKVALHKAKEAAFAATSALSAKQALDKALADRKKGIAHPQEYLNRLRAADAKARDNAKSFGIQQITDDEVSSRQNAARRQASDVSQLETMVRQERGHAAAKKRAHALLNAAASSGKVSKELKEETRKLQRDGVTLKEVKTKSKLASKQTNSKMKQLVREEKHTDELNLLLTRLDAAAKKAQEQVVNTAGKLSMAKKRLNLAKTELSRAKADKRGVPKAKKALSAARKGYEKLKEKNMRSKELLMKYKDAGDTAKDIEAGKEVELAPVRLLRDQLKKKMAELAKVSPDSAEAATLKAVVLDLKNAIKRAQRSVVTEEKDISTKSKEAKDSAKGKLMREKADEIKAKKTKISDKVGKAEKS